MHFARIVSLSMTGESHKYSSVIQKMFDYIQGHVYE